MLNTTQLRRLIIKILNAELSGSELNLFIRYCASLAAAFLVHRKRAGKLAAEYLGDEDSKIQELALDSIAELFAQDRKNNFYQLQEYYRPLESLIVKDADQALFMTRRLIIAHTKQSLAKQFAIKDPAGAKIYRNLALAPQRDPSIKMINYGDSEYFFRWDKPGMYIFPQDFNPEKPEITREAGLRLLGDLDGGRSTILPALVRRFLDILSQETNYRHFISRTQLFRLLKRTLSFQTTVFSEYENISSFNGGQPDQVTTEVQQEYLAFVKTSHRNEIMTRYAAKKKISDEEIAVYTQILDQYFEDSVLDGSPRKLPEYRDETPFRDLDEAVWRVHRGRLEYLVKLSRQALKEKYRHDFRKRDAMVIEGE